MINTIKRMNLFSRRSFLFIFALLFYVFFTAYYMGPAFVNCQDSVYGFGDSTAGPIWRNSLEPKQPLLGGYESATDYPYGESLYSPVSYVALVQSSVMSASSDVVGPVCAYNLYNIAGYLVTSLVVFAFVYYLFRNRWIALLSGYAIAFTPYVQSKVGGHPSYGFAGLLVGLLWSLLHFLRFPTKRNGVILAVILALCAYLDPYFILLAITIVVPVAIVWLAMNSKIIYLKLMAQRGKFWREYKSSISAIIFAMLVFLVLLSPLIYVRIKDASLIDSSIGNIRGNVVAAAMQCSNKPLDYLLPDPRNLYLVNRFGQAYIDGNIAMRNWCGYGESRVSISLTLLVVIIVGLLVWTRRSIKARKIETLFVNKYSTRLLLTSLIGIGLFAALLGLPPRLHGYIMPSGIILKVTEMWRIFAREYLVVNISTVLLAALSLRYISDKTLAPRRNIIAGVLFVLTFLAVIFEYQINPPFNPPTFSYSRDIPQVYKDIARNSNIHAIAEYPIDRMGVEHDSTVYYLTMQAVHKKKLLNSAAIVDGHEKMHIALKDLTDPQTIPALRSLGVKYVVVHGENSEDIIRDIPGAHVLSKSEPATYALTIVRDDDNKKIFLVRLPDGPAIPNMLVIDRGYTVNLNLIQSPLNVEFESLQDTSLKVIPLREVNSKSTNLHCFDIKLAAPSDKALLTVSLNGTAVHEEELSGDYSHITVSASSGDTITLHNSKGYNMRVNNLGCR